MGTQMAKLGFWDKMRYAMTGTPTVTYMSSDESLAGTPDAVVTARTRSVEVYRPPTMLTPDGHAGAGIDKELFAHYLVSVVEKAVGGDIGPADVTFGKVVGRFASVDMTLTMWAQVLNFMIPIGMISREIKDGLDNYMAGLALKVGQAHRGHQDHTEASRLFDKAERIFERLRNDAVPHYASDAEYMFLVSQCQKARRYSPLADLAPTEQIMDRTPATAH